MTPDLTQAERGELLKRQRVRMVALLGFILAMSAVIYAIALVRL